MKYGLVMAAALALLGGCATELDLTDPEQLNAQTHTDEFRFLVPYVDEATVDPPQSTPPVDPCDCVDPACLEAWASANLGCDVCVVLLCDDEWNPHVCNHC